MKRAFAIVIVAILAIGMIGLFFTPFLAGQTTTSTPTYTVSTTTAPADSAPLPANSNPALPNLAQ